MFADTLTFTDLHGTSDYTLNKINQDGYSSEYLYRASTWELRLTIRNVSFFDKKNQKQVDRHTIQLTETEFPVDPALHNTVRKAYFVLENMAGDAIQNSLDIGIGLALFLSASSGANLTKVLNFES